jgi:D-aspartate ligase
MPAVVLGADINGLGVVRSLAREGVRVWLVDSDGADPAMRTRHARKILFRSLSGVAVIDELVALRQRFTEDPVLFLTREASVAAVSGDIGRIAGLYRISMPEADILRRLMDKAEFQELAQQLGLPIPRAVHLRAPADLADSDALEFPCVLKPVVKTPAYEQRQLKKAYKIANAAELRAIFGEIAGAAEMIAQEWIEGGDDRIYFCLQYRPRTGGNVSFVGRKLRSWPPGTGGTASCVPAPEYAEELVRLTDALFGAVGFFGIGSMEFKRDARSGKFLMIEPTVGRTDFQEEIATINGVNIPYAAYCCEIGRDMPRPRRIAPGAAWAVASIDSWSSELQPLRNRGFPKGLRRYDALWRLDDPLPWCYTMKSRIKSRFLATAHLLR